jgi:hypothetical protein
MAIEKMRSMDAYINTPDWKVSIEDKKTGLVISTRTSDSGLNCVKGTTINDFSPD